MKKKIIIIVISIFSIFIIFFSIYCYYGSKLTAEGINGYDGMSGIIRLKFQDKVYTKLTDNPLQLLIKQDDVEEFAEQYFDTADVSGVKIHSGKLDGILYYCSQRAFTSYYWIITIEDEEEYLHRMSQYWWKPPTQAPTTQNGEEHPTTEALSTRYGEEPPTEGQTTTYD